MKLAILFFLFTLTGCLSDLPKTTARCEKSDKAILTTPIALSRIEENRDRYPILALNLKGEVLKEWSVKGHPFYSIFDDDSLVVLKTEDIHNNQLFQYYGHYRNIEVIKPSSRKVYDLSQHLLHHDITVDDQGYYWAIGYEEIKHSRLTQLGWSIDQKYGHLKFLGSTFIKFDKQFNLIKKYHSVDFYLPKFSQVKKLDKKTFDNFNYANFKGTHYYKLDHFNSIQSVKDGNSRFLLLSDRTNSKIMTFNLKSEKIDRINEDGHLHKQHDPQWLGDGRVSLFDNGHATSAALIYNINKKETEWSFRGSQLGHVMQSIQMASLILSGMAKVDDNSFLVTEGVRGFYYLVTKDKRVKAKFFNPIKYESDKISWPNYPVFKSRVYPAAKLCRI